MTRKIQVWSLPDDPDGFRLLLEPPVESFSTTDTADTVGSGSLSVPRDYPERGQIIDADPTDLTNNRSSLIAVFDSEYSAFDPCFEFFAEEGVETLHDTGKLLPISGNGIRSALDDAVIGPNPDGGGHWIWGGLGPLPPLGRSDLGNINAEWLLYLDRERYGLDITATGGTFTLTANGDTTDPIAFDAGAGTIKSELEALTGIVEVYVQKHEDDSYTIVFYNPTDLASDMTRNAGGLTGGTATLTKLADGFNSGADPTFTITVVTDAGSDTTDPIAWDANEGTVSNRLEFDLTNVEDVTVSGAGTFGDPWLLIFYNPTSVNDVQITFAGAEVVEETQAGVPDPAPVTISERFDQRIDPDAHGTYGDPPIEVVDTPLNTGSSWTLLVRARSRFSGSQILIRPEAGLYQASIPARPTVTGEYRLVVRDAYENLLAGRNVTLTAGVFTTITLTDIHIPEGSIGPFAFRLGVIDTDPAAWADHYVDWEHATFEKGFAKTTIGEIVRVLKEDISLRGTLAWLEPSWTDTHDSNNVVWDTSELSFQADIGSLFGTHTFGDIDEMGYEWKIRRLAVPVPPFTHEFALYNPGGTDGASASGIVIGAGVQGGSLAKRRVEKTHLLVEALDGTSSWVTDARFAGLSRREGFHRAEQSGDLPTAEKVGSHLLDFDVANLLAAQIQLTGNTVRAYRDFQIGWTVPYSLGSRVGKHDRRVHSITLRYNGTTSQWIDEVTSSRLFPKDGAEGGALMWESIRRLLTEQKRKQRPAKPGPIIAAGKGGVPRIVVGAADASELSKSKADIVSNGTNDPDIFALVISEMGEIRFTEGRFFPDVGPFTIVGRAYITGAGSTASGIDMSGDWTFEGGGMRHIGPPWGCCS